MHTDNDTPLSHISPGLGRSANRQESGPGYPKIRFGLTVKTMSIILLILALLLAATLTMTRAFERLHQQTRDLATTEMEQLMTSVRLVQQAESMELLAARLANANTHAQRRRVLVELTDLTDWVNQLTAQLADAGGNPELISQVSHTQRLLEQNIQQLNTRVAERIEGASDSRLERQITALAHNNRELTGQLAVLMGYFSATMRQQITTQSGLLARDIKEQQRDLIIASIVIFIFTLLAGLFYELTVVRRILHLQRQVSSANVNIDDFDTRGQDEISHLSRTVRSYVQRIQSHERQMQEAHKEMTYLAEHDVLTGLANRRHFHAAAHVLMRQTRQPLCVAIGDIDHFKQINDQYGHAGGDQVLVSISRQLEQGLRESDILARFGGEEFAFVLPVGSVQDGWQVLEKLRARIAATPVKLATGDSVKLSMSFGLTLLERAPIDDDRHSSRYQADHLDAALEKALDTADSALYTAKHKGRNQLVIASEAAHAATV